MPASPLLLFPGLFPAFLAALLAAAACGGDEPVPGCETSDGCAAGEMCRDGMCIAAPVDSGTPDADSDAAMCAPSETMCDAVCADTRSDPAHCGGCGMDCGDPFGATVTCTNGLCTSSCDEGFADCDGDDSNGCETDLASDDANCGACGAVCSGGSCVASSCLVNPRGDGSDGAFLVDAGDAALNTIMTTANGGMGRTELILADATGFAAGQMVLVQQAQGPNAGRFSLHRIEGVAGEVATLNPALAAPYSTGGGAIAQAVVVPQYTDLSVTGGRVVAPAWDGTTGGIVAIAATGTVTIGAGGSIDVDGRGFRGTPSAATFANIIGMQGEGDLGPGARAVTANASGGGGGAISTCNRGPGGGGGAGGEAGGLGGVICTPATAGGVVAGGDGSLLFGGAGGQGGPPFLSGSGHGGGAVVIFAANLEVEGTIIARGAAGAVARGFFSTCGGGGGGGAGGTIYLDVDNAVLGEDLVSAGGGAGGPVGTVAMCAGLFGGDGGSGRVSVRGDSIMGTTVPPAITP